MGKKKKKKSAVSEPKPEASEQSSSNTEEVNSVPQIDISTEKSWEQTAPEDTASDEKSGGDEEIILSDETLAEIGEPDKDLVFRKVARAYEEAKRRREKYKKAGPIFVAVSGVAFLTLIFTLENKITFLILWVITILYTVALMIRAEYKYHQFQTYLGLSDEESDSEGEDAADAEQYEAKSDEQKKDESQNAEQEEQA